MTDDLEVKVEMTDWTDPCQVVHVVAQLAGADHIIREARAGDAMIIELRLNGMVDKKDLLEALDRTFRFPHSDAGFDAAIDLISDLGWMPSAAGYLMVVSGLDQCCLDVAHMMTKIMPAILERCRTGGITFVTVLVSDTSRDVIAEALSTANDRLDRHAARPTSANSTGSVLVTYDR